MTNPASNPTNAAQIDRAAFETLSFALKASQAEGLFPAEVLAVLGGAILWALQTMPGGADPIAAADMYRDLILENAGAITGGRTQ